MLLGAVLIVAACTASGPRGSTTTSVRPPQPPTSDRSGSAPQSSAPRAPRTATILGSGDVLIHPPLWMQAHRDAHGHGYDFGPMYASIAPDVERADLATCEMETPLAKPSGPFIGWPAFNAPPQVLTALTGVGYRTCTTASNHSIDQGYSGVKRTLNELDAAGLQHTGSARTRREARRPLVVTLSNGVKIGQLAY